MGKGVGFQKAGGEPANRKTMADKDKKSGLGATLAFLAVAALLTAILCKLKTVVWNWVTAKRKRASVSQKNLSFADQVQSLLLRHQEKYQGRQLTDKELAAEFSSPPFYSDPIKWRKDNFDGGREYRDDEVWNEDEDDPVIYKGPDLSEHGFQINYQKIKPLEKVRHPLMVVSDLEAHMNLWNHALATKLGLAA